MVAIVGKNQEVNKDTALDQGLTRLDRAALPRFEHSPIGGDIGLKYGGMPNTSKKGTNSTSFESRPVENKESTLKQGPAVRESLAQIIDGQGKFLGWVHHSLATDLTAMAGINQPQAETVTKGKGFEISSTKPEVEKLQTGYQDLPTVTVLRVDGNEVVKGTRQSSQYHLTLAA